MARQRRQYAASSIYHVMLRGVNRDAVFLEDEDYEHFLSSLDTVKAASGCKVLAYCLMPNHVHLMLRTSDEPIGAVVKRLGVRYVWWFNQKYGRVGHLFQDRFRSKAVESDAYLITLLRYVWDNPVEAGLSRTPDEYRWSSRRLVGSRSSLIDWDALMAILPDSFLDDVARAAPLDLDARAAARPGRRPRYTGAEVLELVRVVCGAEDSSDFARLDRRRQQGAIRELRTRSVPYEQISAATGLSRAMVIRLQAGGSDLREGAA